MKQDYSWDVSAREYVKVYRARFAEDMPNRWHSETTVADPAPTRNLRSRHGSNRATPPARCWWTSGRSGAARAGGSRRRSTSWPSDYDGRVVVGKLNVDENPATPMRFSIRGIPTLLLFKGGQIVEQVVGLADKDALKKLIDKHV